MKSFLKYAGIYLLLVGVLILAVPYFMHIQTNTNLLTGWILIITGLIAFVVINKKIL
jgi:uncharacterized membrane protein HdeD (DUF308 family)